MHIEIPADNLNVFSNITCSRRQFLSACICFVLISFICFAKFLAAEKQGRGSVPVTFSCAMHSGLAQVKGCPHWWKTHTDTRCNTKREGSIQPQSNTEHKLREEHGVLQVICIKHCRFPQILTVKITESVWNHYPLYENCFQAVCVHRPVVGYHTLSFFKS